MQNYYAYLVITACIAFYAGYKLGLRELPFIIKNTLKRNQKLENKIYDMLDENIRLREKLTQMENQND